MFELLMVLIVILVLVALLPVLGVLGLGLKIAGKFAAFVLKIVLVPLFVVCMILACLVWLF